MINDRVDLSKPAKSCRLIREIHLHHDGGGNGLGDAREIERDALSREDQKFARIPYHLVIMRPVTAADSLDEPTGNLWAVLEGRPLDQIPASSTGRNEGAIALVWNAGTLSNSGSVSASASIMGATSTLWVPLTTIANGNLMSLDTNEAPVSQASIATAPGVTSGAPDWLVIAVGNETASRATSIANPRVYLYV